MSDRSNERRLAAILAADVAGYTRIMEEDTDGTVAAWTAARDDVIDPTVDEYSGRVVKLTGDGFLVEFSTVQDAVNCAIALQEALAASILNFRMGINLGDIIDDGRDIHGEGVNVAARLEGLAEPGGICISGGVYDQVRNRVDVVYVDMGKQEVKHVSAPVQTYAIRLGATVNVAPNVEENTNSGELAGADEPDIPSIAVLPFDSMSGDLEQEYFADGMTEDLITDLSKVSGLFVVARTSTFVYKGRSVDIRDVARELGVRYVLEGSVRKSGTRVRINAQLIDASTGGHLWAERYDGTVDDVFELQDEVGAKVVSALEVQLKGGEAERLKKVHTSNLDAYELYVRAKATPYPPIKERIDSAREMFQQVIEMDPEFAGGYAGLSAMIGFNALFTLVEIPVEVIDHAFAMARKGIELDDSFGLTYTALSLIHVVRGEFDEAVTAGRKAVECQPNDADAHAFLGVTLTLAGEAEEALGHIEKAIRLNPQFIAGPYLNILCQTNLLAKRYNQSIEAFEANVRRGGPCAYPARAWAIAAYTQLDRNSEAAAEVEKLMGECPQFRLNDWRFLNHLAKDEDRNRLKDALTRAGLPE